MQFHTLNLKTVFIGFLWFVVVICAVISLYYHSYIYHFGYTDSKLWIDTVFYGSMCFVALFVVAGFNKRESRKRFYKKQIEILNLFTENSNQEKPISLTEILSKTTFSETETKGILEYLVEKTILTPSFSEEQKLIYRLIDNHFLDNHLKKMK